MKTRVSYSEKPNAFLMILDPFFDFSLEKASFSIGFIRYFAIGFQCSQNVGFPKGFHVSRALPGMTRFYMSVVLVVLACPMLYIIANMNARCTVSSPQKLVLPRISNDFKK